MEALRLAESYDPLAPDSLWSKPLNGYRERCEIVMNHKHFFGSCLERG